MAIIMCNKIKHVQEALAFCQKYKLHFVIRSSGHSWTAFSLTSDIILNVSGINQIRVLKESKESKRLACWNRANVFVRCGSMSSLRTSSRPTQYTSISYQCWFMCFRSCRRINLELEELVRVSSGKARMTCDHLVSARIVLASGKVVTPSLETRTMK